MSRLSISQAAKDWKISRDKVREAIKAGKLTSKTGARNAKTVDVVDMFRVFGEADNRSTTSDRPDQGNLKSNSNNSEANSFYIDKLIENLETQVVEKDKQIQAKDNQIEDYQIRIDYLQGRIEKIEKELATATKPRLRLPWFK